MITPFTATYPPAYHSSLLLLLLSTNKALAAGSPFFKKIHSQPVESSVPEFIKKKIAENPDRSKMGAKNAQGTPKASQNGANMGFKTGPTWDQIPSAQKHRFFIESYVNFLLKNRI